MKRPIPNLFDAIYENRFLTLFLSMMLFIFLPHFFAENIQNTWIQPLTRSLLLISTFGLVWKESRTRRSMMVVFIIALVIGSWLTNSVNPAFTNIYLTLLFIFFANIAYEIVHTIYVNEQVNFQTVMAVLCGYLVLGILGFFVFSLIHFSNPDAFNIDQGDFEDLMYYTYVTLTTIGYGDITPQTAPAKSAAVVLGIAGQFYTTVIIALIVGKFLQDK